MLRLAVCCDNLKQIDTLNNYLNTFSYCHSINYDLSWISSLDDLLDTTHNKIDILIFFINEDSKYTIYNIDKKIRKVYKKTKVIYATTAVDFTINKCFFNDLNSLLVPIKYSVLEEKLLNCIKSLQNDSYLIDNLDYKDILFIKSNGKISTIYYEDNSIDVSYDIKNLEKKLTSDFFFKCHNDFLINLNKINKISKEFVTIREHYIPISKNKFVPLKDTLLDMLDIKNSL